MDKTELKPKELVFRRLRVWYFPVLLAIVLAASTLSFATSKVTVHCTRGPSAARAGECAIETQALLTGTDVRRLPASSIEDFASSVSTDLKAASNAHKTDIQFVVQTKAGESLSFADDSFLWLDKSVNPAEVAALNAFLSDSRRTAASLKYGGFVGIVAAQIVLMLVFGGMATVWARVEWRITLEPGSFVCTSNDRDTGEYRTTHPLAGFGDVIIEPRLSRLRIRYLSGETFPTPSYGIGPKAFERFRASVQEFIRSAVGSPRILVAAIDALVRVWLANGKITA